jgi:hypothetical protein
MFPDQTPHFSPSSSRLFAAQSDIDRLSVSLSKLSPQDQISFAQRIGITPASSDALFAHLATIDRTDIPTIDVLKHEYDRFHSVKPSPSPEEPPLRPPRPWEIRDFPIQRAQYYFNDADSPGPGNSVPVVLRKSGPVNGRWRIETFSEDIRLILQCFSLRTSPPAADWPIGLSIHVNKFMAKSAIERTGQPLIDVSDFVRPITIEYKSEPLNWNCDFVLIVRFCRFQTLQEMMEEVTESIEPGNFEDSADPIVICPITGRLVEKPVRGKQCLHRRCFSLKNFLAKARVTGNWSCPICKEKLSVSDLRHDREIDPCVREVDEDDDEGTVEIVDESATPTLWSNSDYDPEWIGMY